jgi:putative copper export protein
MDRAALSRWRWRRRGAWLGPTFVAAVLVEGVLLNELPVWGDGPESLFGGLLLAGCLNLIVVAVIAPLAGMALRRRRRDLPRQIAADYAGTVLVGVLFAALLAGGLGHRAALRADREARAVGAFAVARFVRAQEPELAPHLSGMDIMRVEDGMYRTCVPGTDPDRPLCLFVRTDQDPPSVTRDRDREPNSTYRSRGGFE